MEAEAFWVSRPGTGEIRRQLVPEPGPGEVRVRMLHSGISRGTESLVFTGRVPESLRADMRVPFQEGDFPGPVKYGYLAVGLVEAGEADLVGKRVFCLHPHQSVFVVPAEAVTEVPDGIPARRAVLAGTVETAVNILWDAGVQVGDRVAVVGAGMVGLAVTRLLAQIPGVDLAVVDVDADRGDVVSRLGANLVAPDVVPADRDFVVHTSGTAEGLRTALGCLGFDGVVVDASWYGAGDVAVPLGEAYHSRRLTLRSSQVGRVAPSRATRRSLRDRLELALSLLQDPAFDLLLTGDSPLAELPALMSRLARGAPETICHTVTYEPDPERGA